jgi:hypothetical protein
MLYYNKNKFKDGNATISNPIPLTDVDCSRADEMQREEVREMW